MPATTTKPPESDELPEQQRAMLQLSQADRFTMGGHIRNKLRMGRDRLRKTWTDAGQLPQVSSEEVDDDMQILARDITMPAPTPKSRWPVASALALGLGVPATTGVVMAPRIIDAILNRPPAASAPQSPERREYVPVLVPGKPRGVK